MNGAMPCATSPRLPHLTLPAPAPPPRTVPARHWATWRRPLRRSNSSTPNGDLVTLSRDDRPRRLSRRPGQPRRARRHHPADPRPPAALRHAPERLLRPFHETLAADFDEIMAPATASAFSPTGRADVIDQAWIKNEGRNRRRLRRTATLLRRPPAADKLHPITSCNPLNSTEQMGVVGPFYDRLPHFRIDYVFQPAATTIRRNISSPWSMPAAAIEALHAMGPPPCAAAVDLGSRTIAADDLWLSPCYQPALRRLPFLLQARRARHHGAAARPRGDLGALRPRAALGKAVHHGRRRPCARATRSSARSGISLTSTIPAGKFRNAFVDRMIFGRG